MAEFYTDMLLDATPHAGTIADPYGPTQWAAQRWTGGVGGVGDVLRHRGIYRESVNSATLTYTPNITWDGWNGRADDGYDAWGYNGDTDFLGSSAYIQNDHTFNRAMFNMANLAFDPNANNNTYKFNNCLFLRPYSAMSTWVASKDNCTITFNGCTFKSTMLDFLYVGKQTNYVFNDCLFDGVVFHHWYDGIAGWLRIVCANCKFTRSQTHVLGGMSGAGPVYVPYNVEYGFALKKQLPWAITDVTRENMLFSTYGLPTSAPNGACDYGFDATGDRQGIGAFYFGMLAPVITTDVTGGVAPHTVNFSCNADGTVSASWDCGDGTIINQTAFSHTYEMPGTYTVVLTFTDGLGDILTATTTIYVRAWDYSGTGLHVTFSDICLRHATQAMEGVGTVEWGGAGWIYPPAYTGTARGFSVRNEAVSLVYDSRSGQTYEIGIPDLWHDRDGDYTPVDIAARVRFPELVNRRGEHLYLQHIENHAHLNAHKETNRTLAGFDATSGLPTGLEITERVFVEGEPTIERAMLANVPRHGDHAFRQDIHARRIQTELELDRAGWKLLSIDYLVDEIDAATGPAEDWPDENDYQEHLTNCDFVVARDSVTPLLERVLGVELTGTYDSLVEGPDNYSESGVRFGAADGLTEALDRYAGPNTWMIWVGDAIGAATLLRTAHQGTGDTIAVRIDAGSPRTLVVSVAGIDMGSVDLTWNGSGWVHIALVAGPMAVDVYENGTLVGAIATSTLYDHGGNTTLPVASDVSLYGIRRCVTAITAEEIEYYYNDVVANQADGGIEPMMR